MPTLYDLYQETDGTLTVKIVLDDGKIETFDGMTLGKIVARFEEEARPQVSDDVIPVEPVDLVPLGTPGSRPFGWSRTI